MTFERNEGSAEPARRAAQTHSDIRLPHATTTGCCCAVIMFCVIQNMLGKHHSLNVIKCVQWSKWKQGAANTCSQHFVTQWTNVTLGFLVYDYVISAKPRSLFYCSVVHCIITTLVLISILFVASVSCESPNLPLERNCEQVLVSTRRWNFSTLIQTAALTQYDSAPFVPTKEPFKWIILFAMQYH